MKRIFLVGIILILFLSACSAPAQQPKTQQSGTSAYGVYRLDFSVESLSGGNSADWDVRYTYNDEIIKNGHHLRQPLDVFAFQSVRVQIAERNHPENTFSTAFPIAVCNGGSGNTRITVTDSNGNIATFGVTCNVLQVDR